MIRFAYIYAMPGITTSQRHTVTSKEATFHSVAINFEKKDEAIEIAKQLWLEDSIDMIELCGGLANADLVSAIKSATQNQVAIGQVLYGPEFRRPLVDLLQL